MSAFWTFLALVALAAYFIDRSRRESEDAKRSFDVELERERRARAASSKGDPEVFKRIVEEHRRKSEQP